MTITIPEWLLWLLGIPLALIWSIAGVVGVWLLWRVIVKGDGVWK